MTADSALTGILALLVEQREERIAGENDAKKTEVVLRDAGLGNDEIGAVVGKKSDSVRKTIERADAKGAQGG